MAELDLGRVVGTNGIDGKNGLSANANLLDNAYFLNPVNQRGQTTYQVNGYTIDRWRTRSAENIVKVTNTGLTCTRALRQYVDVKTSDTLTVAVCDSNGDIYCASGTLASGAIGGATMKLDLDEYDKPYFLLYEDKTYRWAALYRGAYTKATLPEFTPKSYAAELLECQRYYIRLKTFRQAGQTITTGARFGFTLPVAMRITPTLTLITNGTIICNGVEDVAVTKATLQNINGNRINIYTNHESQSGWSLQTGVWHNGEFELSADL